jgi:hypothetical protein
MKTTSDTLKSIKAQLKYMIDNQYYATLSILQEQNEMFSTKCSANDQHEISEFFHFQLTYNSDAMRYLLELRECLTEVIDTPGELSNILNGLEEEASKGCNEWIFDMYSDVIEYMEQLRSASVIDHPRRIKNDGVNILKAA